MKKQEYAVAGFTLTELLVAMLILSMTVLCIGGGIVVAKTSYDTISRKSESQLLLSTAILTINRELRAATNIKDSSGTISFFQQERGYPISMSNSQDTDTTIYISAIQDENMTKIPLVNEKMNSNSLVLQMKDLKFENNVFSYTVFVSYQNKVLATQSIIIRPLNES